MKKLVFYLSIAFLFIGSFVSAQSKMCFKKYEFNWCKPYSSYETSFANRHFERCEIPVNPDSSTEVVGWRTFFTIDAQDKLGSIALPKDIFEHYSNDLTPYIDTVFYRGPLLYSVRLCKDERPVYVCVQYANKGASYFVTVVETERQTNNFKKQDITKNIEKTGNFTYYINTLRDDSDLNKTESTFLEGTLALLKKHPEARLILSVNTDNVGDHDKLIELSNLKAHQLYETLVKMGANPDQVNFVGYGPDRPATDNNTCIGRMLNNRVVLKVKKPLTDESTTTLGTQ